jgi:hypothetical protein
MGKCRGSYPKVVVRLAVFGAGTQAPVERGDVAIDRQHYRLREHGRQPLQAFGTHRATLGE